MKILCFCSLSCVWSRLTDPPAPLSHYSLNSIARVGRPLEEQGQKSVTERQEGGGLRDEVGEGRREKGKERKEENTR